MKLNYKFSIVNEMTKKDGPYNKKPLIANIKKAIKNNKHKTEYGTIWYDLTAENIELITLVKAISNNVSINKYEDIYQIIR